MLVYIDIFAAVNLLVNLALLLSVAVLTGTATPWWRLTLAAAAGAVYATAVLLIPSTRGPVGLVGTALAMLGIAFWPTTLRKALGQAAALALLSSLVAGMVLAWSQLTAPVGVGRWPHLTLWAVLIPAILTAWLASRWWQGVRRGAVQWQGEVRLDLELHEGRLTALGRIDSGNDAYEPLSGQPVIIMAENHARPLTGPSHQLLSGAGRWPERIRLVPAKGLGGQLMLLPAVRMDRVILRGDGWDVVHRQAYVAIFPGALDPGGRWHALIPTAMLADGTENRSVPQQNIHMQVMNVQNGG